MKGLLKGLRYISQIFESDHKELEMQSGHPTDVKHVAHMGWDGPFVDSSSWMNEFKVPHETLSAPLNGTGEAKEDSATLPICLEKKYYRDITNQRVLLLHWSILHPGGPRGHRSSMNSPTEDPSSSTKTSWGHKNSGLGPVHTSQDMPTSPKSSRRRKQKGASSSGGGGGGGSKRGSRLKGHNSLTEAYSGFSSGSGNHRLKNSFFEVAEEEKECDEISSGVCDM